MIRERFLQKKTRGKTGMGFFLSLAHSKSVNRQRYKINQINALFFSFSLFDGPIFSAFLLEIL